jgi:enolase
MSSIKSITARQILDSRGNPTVEAQVELESGTWAIASVPSGASTGVREAIELRDGENSYLGKGVLKAVQNIKTNIAPVLKGISVFEQKKIDQIMLDLDGTDNKSKLGANSILAVSLACARVGAAEKKLPLYQYLREELGAPFTQTGYQLPNPLMNIINGGAHASNNLDIQEFMIVPHSKAKFSENLQMGVEVFHHLKKVLSEKNYSTNVGDEGGFAPSFENHEQALEFISKAVANAGYQLGDDIKISLDVAASEFFQKDGTYQMTDLGKIDHQELTEYYQSLISKYPFYSIEDGMGEQDFAAWTQLTQTIGADVKTVGDDLFVTNKKILAEGIEKGWANAILVKVNQIGSLTETFETMALAYENKMTAIISHRSGETADSFIADLAVATNAGHIKTGSGCRTDRMAKYNQLLRIEEHLGSSASMFKL